MTLLTVRHITTDRYSEPIEWGEHRLPRSMTLAVKRNLGYVSRSGNGVQNSTKTARTGRGGGRDFAVLMMEAARPLGLAAPLVSGYITGKASSSLDTDITISVTENTPQSGQVREPAGKGISDATNL
jgi:hypothetical protein